MKKTLVALAAVSAVAAFAQTTDGKPGVQIQGVLSAGYQANSWKGVGVSGIDQNGSGTTQVNIRVLEDLGGGMSAYGRLENDFSVVSNAANQGILPTYANNQAVTSGTANTSPIYKTTSGTVGTWGNGELAVGVRAPIGDFAFGALNNAGLNFIQLIASPLQGTSFGGGYGTVLGADPTMSIVRWNNSFRYISPTVNGLTASVIYAAKQTNGTYPQKANGVAATTTSLGVGLNNQVGAKEFGLKYANGPLTLGGAYSATSLSNWCASNTVTANPVSNIGATSTNNNPCYSSSVVAAGAAPDASQDNKQTSLAGSYALSSDWLLSGGIQNTTLGALGALSTNNISNRAARYLNAQYTSGVHTVFASYGYVKENESTNTGSGKTSVFNGFGYNYALSKNTALVARYEQFDDKANVLTTVLGSPNAYSQTQGTDPNNFKRVRSMFGIHAAF